MAYLLAALVVTGGLSVCLLVAGLRQAREQDRLRERASLADLGAGAAETGGDEAPDADLARAPEAGIDDYLFI